MDLAHKHIITRLLEIFESYGIRSLTIDTLAQNIPTAKKNLSQIAKNKEGLLDAIFEFKILEIQNSLDFTKENYKITNAIEELFEINSMLYLNNDSRDSHFYFELHKYYNQQFQNFKNRKKEMILLCICQNLERGKREAYFKHDLPTERTAIEYYNILCELHKVDTHDNYSEKTKHAFDQYIEEITNIRGKEYYKNLLLKEI